MSEQKVGASPDGAPIVLFDGVCNLCNASINFIIDHDRKRRFRFAALQSEAARAALERAGASDDLPDSMILIDSRGVHTRSDAALRIASRLGLPWSLLAVFLALPRFLRDPIYACIARNRYRWFGRQNACRVPAPELRARFLDAGEPARPARSEGLLDTTRTQDRRGLGLGTLPGRFLLVYPVVFMLPFPLTVLGMLHHVPGFSDSVFAAALGWITGLHAQVTQPIIAWMGRMMTGEDPSFEFTGSGDGLASYLGVLLDLIIAAVITLAWWGWRRSRPVSLFVRDSCTVLLRYFLAWVMLSYGFAKLFPLQFPVLGPDRLLQPYGDSSPMGLLWTFMGASPGYQMFAGGAEVLGGLLVLFRRTSLLGALVIAAVMTNVFAMNVFFDVPVKLYSFHYLLFAVILALPDVPRLLGFFVGNVPVAPSDLRSFWFNSKRSRLAIGLVKIALVVALLVTEITSGVEQMRSRGLWATPHELRGVYRVESFEVTGTDPAADALVPDSVRWVRVGMNPPWVATVQRADGTAVRLRMQLDDEASTIALFDRSFMEPPTDPLGLERLDEQRIRLIGIFDDSPIRVTLRRDDSESLFESRRFRWINEYPFNR